MSGEAPTTQRWSAGAMTFFGDKKSVMLRDETFTTETPRPKPIIQTVIDTWAPIFKTS